MLRFDPFDPEFIADPYPIYKKFREEAPVYFEPERKFWLLTRYKDVIDAHGDEATFTSKYGITIDPPPSDNADNSILLQMPEPQHRIAKNLVSKLFSRPRMAALEQFIRKRAAFLLEQAYEKYGKDGEFDFVSEITVQLPLYVIGELLGIPEELRDEVHHLCNSMLIRGADVAASDNMESIQKAGLLFLNLSQDRRANPRDDVISMLIAEEVVDDDGVVHRLSDMEIARRFTEMALAGHETVAKAIPNGAMAFHDFPDQRHLLAEDRSLLTKATDEIVRFDPPSQLQGRVLTREIELDGHTLPERSWVVLATASASRDPEGFPNPDQFDITREVDIKSHYFGYGVHKCLGVHLARQEISIMFDEMFNRFPDWDVDPARVERVVLTNVRGTASLPIRLGQHA